MDRDDRILDALTCTLPHDFRYSNTSANLLFSCTSRWQHCPSSNDYMIRPSLSTNVFRDSVSARLSSNTVTDEGCHAQRCQSRRSIGPWSYGERRTCVRTDQISHVL